MKNISGLFITLFLLSASAATIQENLKNIDAQLTELDSQISAKDFKFATEEEQELFQESLESQQKKIKRIIKKSSHDCSNWHHHYSKNFERRVYKVEEHPWFFISPNYHSTFSHDDSFKSKLAIEGGVSLPYGKGIDLTLGFGSMFSDAEKIYKSFSARFYILEYLRGWYLTAGHTEINDHRNSFLGSLGYSGYRWYLEADFLDGTTHPLDYSFEIGWRFRF